MPSRPLSAWSLSSPWGAEARPVLAALRAGETGRAGQPLLSTEVLGALEQATQRWGAGRVASLHRGRWSDRPTQPSSLAAAGPSYALSVVSDPGHLLRSGLALLDQGRADAVWLCSSAGPLAVSLLIERHGDGEVRLWPTAQARPDATFRIPQEPTQTTPATSGTESLPGCDVLGGVVLAAACLRAGVHPTAGHAEPDRICVVPPGPDRSPRAIPCSVELAL